MERQVYHIQLLLADKLDQCKGKGDERVKTHQNDTRYIPRIILQCFSTNNCWQGETKRKSSLKQRSILI